MIGTLVSLVEYLFFRMHCVRRIGLLICVVQQFAIRRTKHFYLLTFLLNYFVGSR